MSSHLFGDIEDTCDELAVLKCGQVVDRQDLNQLKQIYIVRGEMPESAPPVAELPDFVQFCRQDQASMEVHLVGQPRRWLAWLGELRLNNMRIESGGVRAIYERFHPVPRSSQPKDF
jgi:ABC-type uncharacterized transport system ATPase subunit